MKLVAGVVSQHATILIRPSLFNFLIVNSKDVIAKSQTSLESVIAKFRRNYGKSQAPR